MALCPPTRSPPTTVIPTRGYIVTTVHSVGSGRGVMARTHRDDHEVTQSSCTALEVVCASPAPCIAGTSVRTLCCAGHGGR